MKRHGSPSDPRRAVVFGAGKIGRGFLAHLLVLSGYDLTFVDANPALVDLLRRRGAYSIRVMGNEAASTTIRKYRVLGLNAIDAVSKSIAGAHLVFTATGGPNLPQVGPVLAEGIGRRAAGRAAPLNILICENFYRPAQLLRTEIAARLAHHERPYLDHQVGLVETQVLRSCIDNPEAGPLALKVQNEWRLPADADAFRGPLPPLVGLEPVSHFEAGLIRKLFTYNAINAAVCYAGYRAGYKWLADAARDPTIVRLAEGAGREASLALIAEYALDRAEQQRFAAAALAKYQNRDIVDPITRNCKDPIRKLGRHDRIVGPAALALAHMVEPENLVTVVVNALHYDAPDDAAAQELQRLLATAGLDAVLLRVCGLEPGDPLATRIRGRF